MKGGHDQGTVPDKSPYEVSTAAPKERTQQPTEFQIFGAILLAIVAGVLAFFTTCFGSGLLLYEFAHGTGTVEFAILMGTVAAGFTILSTYLALIRSWTNHRSVSVRKPPSES